MTAPNFSATSTSPVAAVDGVSETIAVKMHQRLAGFAVDAQIGQDVLVDAVVIPLVVRRHLVGPARHAGVGIAREDGHRPFVVARALGRIPRARVAGAVIQQVEVGIVGIPPPRRAAAARPFIPFPGVDAEVGALMARVGRTEIVANQHVGIRAGAVGAPDLLAGVDVVGGHESRAHRTHRR